MKKLNFKHIAGYYEIVKLLLKNGANTEFLCENKTARMWADLNGNLESAKRIGLKFN